MARIRTIKPEFFKSLAIADLPNDACRLTFIGLWCYADDAGRGIDDPRLIKAELWPLDDEKTWQTVDEIMGILAQKGRLTRYQVGTKKYFEVVNWSEHQSISHPKDSKIPAPVSVREGSGEPPEQSSPRVAREEQGTGNREQGTGKDLPAPPAVDEVTDEFEVFWRTYPTPNSGTKPDKAKTLALWRKLTRPQRKEALVGVKHYRTVCDAGRFAKDPLRWMRDKCWVDYQILPVTPTKALVAGNGRSRNAEAFDQAAEWLGIDPAAADPFGGLR